MTTFGIAADYSPWPQTPQEMYELMKLENEIGISVDRDTMLPTSSADADRIRLMET